VNSILLDVAAASRTCARRQGRARAGALRPESEHHAWKPRLGRSDPRGYFAKLQHGETERGGGHAMPSSSGRLPGISGYAIDLSACSVQCLRSRLPIGKHIRSSVRNSARRPEMHWIRIDRIMKESRESAVFAQPIVATVRHALVNRLSGERTRTVQTFNQMAYNRCVGRLLSNNCP